MKEGCLLISVEPKVLPNSNYFFYTPSAQARNTFFYPICIGYFYYDKGYHLFRNHYDSFLIMYIKKGHCHVSINTKTYIAQENQIIILDCYKPHSYYTTSSCEVEWLHFDGPIARNYFDLITADAHFIVSLKDTFTFEKHFHKLYQIFSTNAPIKEALISQYITTLLTELILTKDDAHQNINIAYLFEDITTYINENFNKTLTLETLAQKASLSPYYFTRLFKKETGFTPHEYLIAVRINSAKFLLKNTTLSIKQVGFNCGFTSESSFCSTFKKWVNTTPTNYRSSLNIVK